MSALTRMRRRPRRCPICKTPAEGAHYPFCSARCAEIDLGRWLAGDYRIPASEVGDEGDDGGGDDDAGEVPDGDDGSS